VGGGDYTKISYLKGSTQKSAVYAQLVYQSHSYDFNFRGGILTTTTCENMKLPSLEYFVFYFLGKKLLFSAIIQICAIILGLK
jgi:hypothetical protein